ncbi:MAG: Uncharacterised protein [Cryomorphaceae bacterium]|nr:MAG: Uncharacterised protein [Cryomorphaceae bacterium]
MIPVFVPEIVPEVTLIVLVMIEDTVVPSKNKILGLLTSERSKTASPFDSSQFKIPSLSISRSILSITKSPSASSGQTLTGTMTDLYSDPEQSRKPTNW